MSPQDPAVDAAIDWMVLLRSGEATASDAQRHRAWQAADPRHAAAWAHVSRALARSIEPLREATPGPTARAAVVQVAIAGPARRRVLRSGLAMAGGAVAAGWTLRSHWPAAALMTDLRTGTGERCSVMLDDGSRLVMNARTAVDVDFDGARRRLRLREGELIVRVAADAARPFFVESAQGHVRALGTRFMVRQEAGSTLAIVLEHSVLVRTAGGMERTLYEGDAARFTGEAIEETASGSRALANWERGMLSADDRPLAEVIEALRAYRPGLVRLSPEAGRLRVLGAFPLDDTDRALDSLAQTLPLRVSRYGPWLTVVDVRR